MSFPLGATLTIRVWHGKQWTPAKVAINTAESVVVIAPDQENVLLRVPRVIIHPDDRHDVAPPRFLANETPFTAPPLPEGWTVIDLTLPQDPAEFARFVTAIAQTYTSEVLQDVPPSKSPPFAASVAPGETVDAAAAQMAQQRPTTFADITSQTLRLILGRKPPEAAAEWLARIEAADALPAKARGERLHQILLDLGRAMGLTVRDGVLAFPAGSPDAVAFHSREIRTPRIPPERKGGIGKDAFLAAAAAGMQARMDACNQLSQGLRGVAQKLPEAAQWLAQIDAADAAGMDERLDRLGAIGLAMGKSVGLEERDGSLEMPFPFPFELDPTPPITASDFSPPRTTLEGE